MKSEFNKLEIPQAAVQEIRDLSNKALQEIAGLPGNEVLKEFAEKLVGRAK